MPAASRARRAFELGLDICVFLFLPVLALAPKGVAPLAAVAGLCALGLAWPQGTAAWPQVRGPALIFGALLVWGILSALWAVDPQHSLAIALRLAGMFAGGLALMLAASEIAAPERLAAWFCAGLVLGLVLTVVQYASLGALTAPFARRGFALPALDRAENGFEFTLLPLVAMLVLRGRWFVALMLATATAAVICILVGDAARIAFATAIVGAASLYFWRRALARLAAAVSVMLILTAPLLFPPLAGIDAVRHDAQEIKVSMWHRLQIWSFVGDRIAERPWLGWGLDSSRAIPGGTGLTPDGHQWLPLHPHNAALQLRLELGVPGAVLFALFAARLWLALGAVAWPRLYAAAAGGSLVATLVVALASYGIWQEWLIDSEFLTLFLILAMARIAVEPPQAL
jgi:O-antigen ligase